MSPPHGAPLLPLFLAALLPLAALFLTRPPAPSSRDHLARQAMKGLSAPTRAFVVICSALPLLQWLTSPPSSITALPLLKLAPNAARAPVAPPPPTCGAVMQALIDSKPAEVWPPPCPLPPEQRRAFEGPEDSMPITKDFCSAQRYDNAAEYALDFNEAFIDGYCARVASGAEKGSYAHEDMEEVQNAMRTVALRLGGGGAQGPPSLAGTVGMVFGTENPWVECVALNLGAPAVWTFEYGTIHSTHPRLKAKPYREIAKDYRDGRGEPLDWAASYSSLEHSGLGRYGDALNPEGDAEALAQIWCMLKPGGVLLLGLGTSCRERGYIEFNGHRVYGFRRLAHVARGFELLGFSSVKGETCNPLHQANRPHRVAEGGQIVLLRKPLTPPERELTWWDFAAAAKAAPARGF